MRLSAAFPLALVSVLVSCSHAKKAPPPAPLPVVLPLVAFEAVKVEGLGFVGAGLSFRARVDNPNPTPISAVRVEYALDLEGSRAAVGAVDPALSVPAADAAGVPGTSTFTLPVQVRFAGLPGFAKALAEDREADYALGGAVVFSTPAGEVRVPMAQTGRVTVPKRPRIRVEKVVLRSASPREIALEMRIDVENPNDFDVPPGRIGCGLHLSGKEVVRADVLVDAPIAAHGSASLPVPIRISVLKAGKAVAKLLIPFTSLKVALKGEAVFGGVPVPLDLTTSILPAG